MGMPNSEILQFPSNDAQITAAIGTGKVVNASDIVAGYDYQHDGDSEYTAVLEGSVAGKNWTDIVELSESGQGLVPAHYTQVRIKVTVAGAIGDSVLMYMGKS